MDDGSFFGDSRDVLKAWNIVKDEGPALGLFPNVSKCELISPSFSSSAFHEFEPELLKQRSYEYGDSWASNWVYGVFWKLPPR